MMEESTAVNETDRVGRALVAPPRRSPYHRVRERVNVDEIADFCRKSQERRVELIVARTSVINTKPWEH
jgi:hypothetical protein